MASTHHRRPPAHPISRAPWTDRLASPPRPMSPRPSIRTFPWPGMAHGLATERLFEQTLSATGPLTALTNSTPGQWLWPGVELDEGILAACRL